MKLAVVTIADRGVANKERLYLRVLLPTNLYYYVVFATAYGTQNTVNNIPRHAYWFGSQEVKPGDHIILVTGLGTNSKSTNPDGTNNYFYFWGLPNTIFIRPEDTAVVFEVSEWVPTARGG